MSWFSDVFEDIGDSIKDVVDPFQPEWLKDIGGGLNDLWTGDLQGVGDQVSNFQNDIPSFLGGGGGTEDTPAAPSTGESVNEWIKYLPQIFEMQSKYGNLELKNQLEMLNKYLPQFTQTQYDAQNKLYPQTGALQEQLAGQAAQGMNGGAPNWYQQKYADMFNSQLGTNAGSPMGADYFSRGMLEQEKNWGDYYRNLGLSVTNRMPLTSPSMGQSTNYMQGFTPQGVGQQMGQNYGNYANAYTNMAQIGNPWQTAIAGIGGSVLGNLTGVGSAFNPFTIKQEKSW